MYITLQIFLIFGRKWALAGALLTGLPLGRFLVIFDRFFDHFSSFVKNCRFLVKNGRKWALAGALLTGLPLGRFFGHF